MTREKPYTHVCTFDSHDSYGTRMCTCSRPYRPPGYVDPPRDDSGRFGVFDPIWHTFNQPDYVCVASYDTKDEADAHCMKAVGQVVIEMGMRPYIGVSVYIDSIIRALGSQARLPVMFEEHPLLYVG